MFGYFKSCLYILEAGFLCFKGCALISEIGGVKVGTDKKIQLSEKEEKLIKLLRETEFGEIKIIVQDGIPTRVEEIKKSIKL